MLLLRMMCALLLPILLKSVHALSVARSDSTENIRVMMRNRAAQKATSRYSRVCSAVRASSVGRLGLNSAPTCDATRSDIIVVRAANLCVNRLRSSEPSFLAYTRCRYHKWVSSTDMKRSPNDLRDRNHDARVATGSTTMSTRGAVTLAPPIVADRSDDRVPPSSACRAMLVDERLLCLAWHGANGPRRKIFLCHFHNPRITYR